MMAHAKATATAAGLANGAVLAEFRASCKAISEPMHRTRTTPACRHVSHSCLECSAFWQEAWGLAKTGIQGSFGLLHTAWCCRTSQVSTQPCTPACALDQIQQTKSSRINVFLMKLPNVSFPTPMGKHLPPPSTMDIFPPEA